MVLLHVIWMVAAALLSLALLLWIALLVAHALGARRDARLRKFSDDWLDRLLLVLDGGDDPSTLPQPASRDEMEAVVGLLRELAERFRGSFRVRMVVVLQQIGAADFGKKLLRSWSADNRVRGAALLGWCGEDRQADEALDRALEDRDPRVTLEAAASLVKRRAVDDIERVLRSLCRTRAAHSLVARDLFRQWATEETSDWSQLLRREWPEPAWILLLEAAGAAARAEWTPWVAARASHPSPTVARTALRALETIGDPDGSAAAAAACGSDFPVVRRQAAAALGSCGSLADAGPILGELLGDADFEVRRAALEALLRLGGKPALVDPDGADAWQRELFREAGLPVPTAA